MTTWNVDKPETKAEQQQGSSRCSMETSEEDMKVLERVTVIFKYVLGGHSEDMKPLHNGTVKKELLSSLFYLSFPQPMLESKPMLAKVGNGRQGVSQTVRKGPCPYNPLKEVHRSLGFVAAGHWEDAISSQCKYPL